MSDIFKEVEEDLRRERLKAVWDRYGIIVILAAVGIVLFTLGYQGYNAWQTSSERSAGDAFAAQLRTAETGGAGAAERLLTFAEGAPGGYAMLARFRAATAQSQAGNTGEAAALLRDIASDGAVGALYQDLATVRLGQTLLDAGDPGGAQEAVAVLAEDAGNPFTHAAQEIMGIAAYARSDSEEARRWFTSLEEGEGVPLRAQQRARVMLALLEQNTRDAAPSAADAAPAAGGTGAPVAEIEEPAEGETN